MEPARRVLGFRKTGPDRAIKTLPTSGQRLAVGAFGILTALALVAVPAQVRADAHYTGDPEAGETAFARQCVSCHVVVNAEGEMLAGRKSKTGPNLFGVAGHSVGTVSDFRYGKSLLEVAAKGIVWDETNFVAYVQDPTNWLRTTLDDNKARSRMTFKVRRTEDALNIYAYLQSIGPVEKPAGDDGATEDSSASTAAAVPDIMVTYSSEQADRGEKRYEKECEECHGKNLKGGLNGGAPIRGLAFTDKYASGTPASALFMFMKTAMPPNKPGRFSDSSYADLMAYVLKMNGFRAGAPLPTDLDVLDSMIIDK